MVRAIISWSLHNRLIVIPGVLALIAVGIHSATNLNVEAYPDPTPPLVEVITQNPGASPEEMERLIGIPIETALNGMPGLEDLPEHLDRRPQRHQVPVRLRDRLLGGPPGGHQPDRVRRQPARRASAGALALEPDRRDRPLRPRRARLHDQPAQGRAGLGAPAGPEDRARRDRRDRLRRDGQAVSGLVDTRLLRQYNVTLQQVEDAINKSNANVGGDILTLGSQAHNVRAIGLLGGGHRPARPGQRRPAPTRSRPRSSTRSTTS